MLSNYHTLRYVASTLDSTLRGRRVTQVFTQDRDELAVEFDGITGCFIISCRIDSNTCYLHPQMARAKTNSVDLFPRIVGSLVRSVSIHPSDRIITIALDSGDALVLQFFGARSNVLLVGGDGIVNDAFQRAKQTVGAAYTVVKKDLIYDVEEFHNAVRSWPSVTISSAMKTVFPSLGTTLVQEILHRSGIAPTVSAGDVGAPGLAEISRNLQTLLVELGTPSPRILFDRNGNPTTFSLVRLHREQEASVQTFDDIHAAIRVFLSRRRASTAVDARLTGVRSSIRQHVEKLRRTVHTVEEDARQAERADEYERNGAALMANLQSARRGDHSVILLIDGRQIEIALDPARTPAQNAQRYFSKAKQARRAAAETSSRLASVKGRLARGEELLALIDGITRREEWEAFQVNHAVRLDEFGIGQKRSAQAHLPFRIFSVDGGFEVWAGKSSQNNDLLTLRHAKPDDLWFHARGSGGSHVILKVRSATGEPSKRAKLQAAAIAAYYSKMKNASMVPVAMTERKYVRKPKGAPSGTVVLEREQVIFAEPALPEEKNQP